MTIEATSAQAASSAERPQQRAIGAEPEQEAAIRPQAIEISVVLPCLNGEATLAEQLEALSGQDFAGTWELVFVDNGCTDRSVPIVESYRSRIGHLQIVAARDRQNQAYALNVGVRAARGRSVVFCDADDIIGEGWLNAMAAALQEHEFVCCRYETAKLNPPWIARSRQHAQTRGINVYKYPRYLPHAGGGSLGVRRELLLRMGEFEESLPVLHDTDMCWRLQREGHAELQFVPDAVLHLRYRHRTKDLFRQAFRRGEYNALLYKRYRERGMPKIHVRDTLASWHKLLRTLIRAGSREGRAQAVLKLGWTLGRVWGSIKHRVYAL